VYSPDEAQCGSTPGGGCQVAVATATCPAGSVAIGGGFAVTVPDDFVSFSAASAPNEWTAIATNLDAAAQTLNAFAVCASGPGIKTSGATDVTERLGSIEAALADARAKLSRR